MKKMLFLLTAVVCIFAPMVVFGGEGILEIKSVAQPSDTFAPRGAVRLDFTKVKFCAKGGSVSIYGVQVERQGPNGVLDGVVLLRDGAPMGVFVKGFDAENRALLGTDSGFVIPNGVCYMMTVSANISRNLYGYEGENISLPITGIWTTASVQGFSWVDGASHVVNSTYNIGGLSVEVSSLNPFDGDKVEIGTAVKVFASLKVTPLYEGAKIKSVIFKMSGTALEYMYRNVFVFIDGKLYETVILPDGRYYAWGMNDLVEKGRSVKITITAEVVAGVGNTIAFDVVEAVDLFFKGAETEYGLVPEGIGPHFGDFPWFRGSVIEVVSEQEPPPPPIPTPLPTAEQRAGVGVAVRYLLIINKN